jgi:5-methylthioadenosine/S-adenosylhomocysteine deaminase
MTAIYSARWVLPIISPLIEDGAVAINDTLIVAVGSRPDLLAQFPESQFEDFGNAVILPGLVNAHSHLELTVMRGFLEREERDFFAWLRKLTLARLAMTENDLLVSATCGAIEAARAGVTCLGDASSAATQAMIALNQTGLRGIVYQESFGPDPQLANENVTKLRDQIAELRGLETGLVRAGVSPHAPYSVSGRQLQLISQMAIDQKLPLMMHAAESHAEQMLMQEGLGPFAEGLKARGIEWHAPQISTIKYLERQGVLEAKPLFAHCINVDDSDLELIKRAGAGIAHCPKSNAKLGHGRAPFSRFLSREVNVGLGSDSVASNNNCDLLEEARFATLLARLPATDLFREGLPPADSSHSNEAVPVTVSSEQSLFAATLGGARAMGRNDQIGSLAPGLQADLAIVDLMGAHQQPLSDPAAALIFSSSGRDVVLTLVAGKAIYRDGKVSGVDEAELQRRLNETRVRLDKLD